MLYINKKEALSLLQGAGLQLPSGLMPRDGFIHSIREKASPVKPKFENITESQQFKRLFEDWEKHPNTASKVQLIKEKYDAVNVGKDVVVVFESNQIKSADPVTYDDNGKVIIYYYFFKTLLKLRILCDIIKK